MLQANELFSDQVFGGLLEEIIGISITNSEPQVLDNMVVFAVIVKQEDIVLYGNRSNHAVNWFPNRNTLLSKVSVNVRHS